MIERAIHVTEEEGLHTRPANKFVKLVKEGNSTVTVSKGDMNAPGTSLLKLMKLGIVKGDMVTISCDGDDEEALMASIIRFLQPEEA